MSSYLFTWLLFLGLALGGMANLMLHNLTGGSWGKDVRPVFGAATRLVPVAALLGLPVVFFSSALFPLRSNTWFDPAFFSGRFILYLAVWSTLAVLMVRDRNRQAISAAGLIVYAFTISFAATDWIASLVPRWYSSGLGLVVGVAQMGAAMALAIALTGLKNADSTEAEVRARSQDLGNLLFMYLLTWAYLAFMQFLIIWVGNLPREISWYVPRLQTNWVVLGVLLVIFHFFMPLAILLSRQFKRSNRALGRLAAGVLVMHALYVYWLIAPSVRPGGFEWAWADVVFVLAFAALCRLLWKPAYARAR